MVWPESSKSSGANKARNAREAMGLDRNPRPRKVSWPSVQRRDTLEEDNTKFSADGPPERSAECHCITHIRRIRKGSAVGEEGVYSEGRWSQALFLHLGYGVRVRSTPYNASEYLLRTPYLGAIAGRARRRFCFRQQEQPKVLMENQFIR